MRAKRQCSKTACDQNAIATLTYVYQDSTAVLGPLASSAEPHAYDLCEKHVQRLTVPRGWEVLRVPFEEIAEDYDHDDLLALANAIREAGKPNEQDLADVVGSEPSIDASELASQGEIARHGHLRVLKGSAE